MTSNTISRYLAPALRVAVLIAAALCPLALKAQTDQQFTQYYQVPSLYNPAAIASTDNIRVRLGGRLQWVGIEHAPKGFLLTGDMPFKLFKKRWGVGLVAQQESAGLFRNLTVSAQLAYKQPLFKGTLTAAVQVGYANEQFRGSEVFIPDDNDYHDPDVGLGPRSGCRHQLRAPLLLGRRGLYACQRSHHHLRRRYRRDRLGRFLIGLGQRIGRHFYRHNY